MTPIPSGALRGANQQQLRSITRVLEFTSYFTAKNKGFHRGFLRVFIVSLRENLFVVFIKTFSQKPSQNHWYERFLIKTLREVFLRKGFNENHKKVLSQGHYENPQKTPVLWKPLFLTVYLNKLFKISLSIFLNHCFYENKLAEMYGANGKQLNPTE